MGRKLPFRLRTWRSASWQASWFPAMYSCIGLLRNVSPAFVLMPFVIAFIGDSFSMLGGMAFGHKKFAPHVSPNKTWAGFLAGPVGSALGMVLLGLASKWIWQMELPLWYLAVIGIAANLFGQLGDLSMSLIKREAGIKDYSHIFLTHGGVLDRFDSTLFLGARRVRDAVLAGEAGMTKTITILGSTGSIGRQTLSVADELGLRVAALTAERNVDLMEAQCRKYRPKLAVLTDEAAAEELKVRLADMNIRVLAGAEALCEAAALPEADTVVVAVCGFAALRPTLTAIHEKKRIALANKETMVCAGQIMQAAARGIRR